MCELWVRGWCGVLWGTAEMGCSREMEAHGDLLDGWAGCGGIEAEGYGYALGGLWVGEWVPSLAQGTSNRGHNAG